ncbi:MAG: hypothetical protein KAJ12_03290, partial [Bacteroidetes bacterium]|nr:hypothetical protein [Bacteroidota bacterium]
MRRIGAVVWVLIICMMSAVSQERYSQVRIAVSSREDVRKVARLGIPVDHAGGRPGRWMDLFVSDREVELLKKNGIPFTILVEDWEEYYRQRQQEESLDLARLVSSSSVEHFHLGTMGGFLTLKEVMGEL